MNKPFRIIPVCAVIAITETPPTFLVHANDDKGVSPENSIYFYLALRKAKVPAEMHVYERGGHGFGLGKQHSAESSWSVRCEDWMRGQGLLDISNRPFRNTESNPR